jgi:ATP-dependent RNA helicase DeaD
MFINLGKKDGIDVPRLLNLIHKQCGVRGKNVGRVDLKGVFSFFDVDKGFTDEIIKGFAGAVIGGRKIRIEISGDRPTESSHRKGRSRGSYRGGSDRGGSGGHRRDSRDRDRRRKSDGPRYSDRKKREA